MKNLLERVEALEHHLRTLAAHPRTVERRLRLWRRLACGLVVLLVLGLIWSSSTAQEERPSAGNRSLGQRLDDLEDTLRKLRKLQKLVTHVTVAKDDAGRPEIIFSGVNLRIVNGLGRTDCGPVDEPIPDCPNGLGNLIVGYNEPRPPDVGGETIRTGSHNVVVGTWHNFSRFGGGVAGQGNTISGDFAVVSGGFGNTASGSNATVSGGRENTASGGGASVSGGDFHTATETGSSVSGGFGNTASGGAAAVSGGGSNTASGTQAAVSGGVGNTASGFGSSVSGGGFDVFSGEGSVNTASGDLASVSGGSGNTAAGRFSSVSGGQNRTAEGEFNWVAGSLFEED